MKRVFSKEFMLDILDCGYLERKLVDHSRWSLMYEIVFEHEGKYYKASYTVGATEVQDESPWEYEDEVTCFEVHKVSKTIEVWEEVKEE